MPLKGKSTLSSRTALRQYNHESNNKCPCVGNRTPRKVEIADTILADGISTTMKNT